MNYRVSLDVYSGPLDLLIYLIKRTEVDIRDVSVAQVIDQFIDMIHQMRTEVDLELAGEFLVLASTLLELKSELMLPGQAGADAAEQLQLGLVRQLIEYKRYRDLALALDRKGRNQSRCFHRPEGLLPAEDREDLYLEDVGIGDLFRAWLSMVVETELSMRTIVYDDRPVEEVLDELREVLPLDTWVPLHRLIPDANDRARLIGIFWGILELTRRQECRVEQGESGDIMVKRVAPPPPGEVDTEQRLDRSDEPDVEAGAANAPEGNGGPDDAD
ncbi:MAG: ScpA family protein [Planctomycetota bacterium]